MKKAEITSGIYLADSLVKINYGHIITSILNTREQDVDIPNSVVKVVKRRDHNVGETALIGVAE